MFWKRKNERKQKQKVCKTKCRNIKGNLINYTLFEVKILKKGLRQEIVATDDKSIRDVLASGYKILSRRYNELL